MRTLLPVATLLFLAAIESPAQPACPDLHFNAVPSASLSPSATTRLNLVRQSDGSYTSYETARASPYRLISASPHFEEQLTACLPAVPAAQAPVPAAPANPAGSPSQKQAVAVLSSGNYLVVTLNSSGGIDAAVFGPQMNLVSVTSYAVTAQQLALADVNGDGNPDIVFVASPAYAPGQLTILLGKGGSSFQPFGSYSIPPIPVGLPSLAIADLNGDGKLDIAVAVAPLDGGGSIATFLGNGDGMFQTGSALTLTGSPVSVAIADLNGDGKPDLAVLVNEETAVTLGDGVAVALGNGDGTFATPSYVLTAGGGSIAIGDMNSDGNPDIVTSGTILFGDGAGAFPTRQDYDLPINSTTPGSVVLTDFNGDGRTDVVIAGGTPAVLTGLANSAITVLFAQPGGTFFGPAVSITPVLSANSLIFDLRGADFNDDGIPDLAYGGQNGVGVMLGKGDGTFASSFSAPSGSGYLATGDFNRDGNQDIVALLPYLHYEPSKSSALEFFAGNGNGTFQAAVMTSLSDTPAAFATGDFNGDGKLDVAVMSSTENFGAVDAVLVYLGNGDGTFSQGETYPAGPGANWILAGDLNNDGIPDLVVTNAGSQTQTGKVSTFLGKGDGTFTPAASLPLAVRNAEGYTGSMSLADFNLDGKLDLAVLTNPGLAILLGNGDGTFQALLPNTPPAAAAPAADLNGDGIPDLIATNGEGSSYLLGYGNGTFQAPVPVNAVAGGLLLIADVNRDGKPDLVSVSPASPLGVFSLLNLSAGAPFQVVSSATYAEGPVAADSFVSAFGTNLPASTTGLSILVTDSAGVSRPATALYASPTQINFIMPAGTSTGLATVSIASPANATPLVAHVEIVPVAAGLFTMNAAGLAAAYAVLVDAQGNQSYEPAFSVQHGAVVAAPINLGAATDKVYLTLFGTGFDNAVTGGVNAAVAGQAAPGTYAGPQGAAGLDQVNVLLPHALSGRGDSSVVLSAPGSVANTVHITIQ